MERIYQHIKKKNMTKYTHTHTHTHTHIFRSTLYNIAVVTIARTLEGVFVSLTELPHPFS